jgi:putative membrane protein insertion efficiency factor
MIKKIIRTIFIIPVKIYQWVISPLFPPNCRFQPTCSNYTIEAIMEWGIFKGGWLAIKRIGKCHPWGPHGPDPVPKKRDVVPKVKSS